MSQQNLRGSRAHVPKPGIYVFDKIREEHSAIVEQDKIRRWVNDVPEMSYTTPPLSKRKALGELPNGRLSKRRITTCMASRKESTKVQVQQGQAQRQPVRRNTRAANRLRHVLRRMHLNQSKPNLYVSEMIHSLSCRSRLLTRRYHRQS
jgi:hypothetical protein